MVGESGTESVITPTMDYHVHLSDKVCTISTSEGSFLHVLTAKGMYRIDLVQSWADIGFALRRSM